MKKILQILPSLNKINGGVERGTLDIARELAIRKFKPLIISSGGEMAEKYKYKGVDHIKMKLDRKGIFNFILNKIRFSKILDEVKPDLVHIRSRWPSFCFSKMVKKRNIPLVTTYHGTYSGSNSFFKRQYNKVMTEGDAVITISKFIDGHVRHFFPEKKKNLVQINRGIDTEYFNLNSVTEIRKENFLSRLSISEDTHILLLPARLSSWKGHNVAIDAMNYIYKKKPELDFTLLLVGSENGKANYTKKLENKINSLDLNERVFFCGNLNDMPAVYSTADIILSTSVEPEAFGRISAEAASMGKPVISSNHGGSREIIENNISGWLVEPNNYEELGEKIIHVLELKQEKKDLIGETARKRVIEKFKLQKMLDETIAVYEELIARKANISN